MASTMRTIAQIPARVKYLLVAIESGSTSTVVDLTADDCFAFECAAGSFLGSSHVTVTEGNTILNASSTNAVGVNLIQSDLYKDLGRQIVVYNPTTKTHVAIFREVQQVEGPGTGGVPVDYPIARFIKVWSASGAGVYVARNGP